MLQIEGEKIILKEFDDTNLNDPVYFDWLRDLEIVTQLYRLEYLKPIRFAKIEEYVRFLYNSDTDCFFAVFDKATQKFIGTQRIGHINWRSGVADIGLLIGDKEYRGRGYSIDIVKTSVKYAFEVLSLRKLTGGTSSTNEAMIKCFKRVGFEIEGILKEQLLMNGKYLDHIIFGLLKDHYYASIPI